MNFVLGFVVLAVLLAAQNSPSPARSSTPFEDGALCGQTGLQAGDKIWP